MKNSSSVSEKLVYRLSYGSFGQFVKVSVTVSEVKAAELDIFLSSWRPGRYELGNFSKNVRHFKVTSSSGMELSFNKISKNQWKIKTEENSEVVISYEYFAVRPDAGSCWLDEDIFYVNPVHCCIGIKGMEQLPCRIILDLPAEFKTATSLRWINCHEFTAADYDELVDSPILASSSLLHESYAVNDLTFHLWFYGVQKINRKKVISDFSAFTRVQLNTMGDFPVSEYHFLILVLPFRFYHGVEHLKSTVLALGPADELMTENLYPELIGVASHELFHVWNVKTIRPAEMMPYNYHHENYSTSGWVYEGITTYYGDLFLARSGFFSVDEYLAEITARLQKHLDNPGKDNYSVLESSFDTWLDGYEPGVPGRKTSIYDEGSLIALMFDLYIRKNNPHKSLDDFVRLLYVRFGKAKVGYRQEQLIDLLKEVTGDGEHAFFEQMLTFRSSYLAVLKELFENLALDVKLEANSLVHERRAGFRTDQSAPYPRISSIYPGAPADHSGLMHGDEVVEIREEQDKLILSVLRFKRKKEVQIALSSSNRYFDKAMIIRKPEPSPDQETAFQHWFTGVMH
ncbi:MAG: M61 family metallopeptidase [Bacteroidia bacterium]|nr:M61 family metallopeptidase [Bacteroidia bacterium]